MSRIRLTVNGRPVEAEVAPRTHLADFLREQLLLTGTHIGCEHGICGACTVEIDGEIARSCITFAMACDGARVRTIEGFDDDALMGRLRQAFTQHHALQCGYCTPGMLVAARDLVRRKRGLTRAEIRTEMSGNLCRCTGYVGIVNAIEGVMAGEGDRGSAPTPPGAWLGPAPGPGRTSAQGSPAAAPVRPANAQTRPPLAAGRPSSVAVTVGAIEQVDGATRITQSFTLPHGLAAVWALMADPAAVAACVPGLSVDPALPDGTLPGRMEIALGPIKASFSGLGSITTMAQEHRQIIAGRGGDRRSGSQANGSVDYRLTAQGGDATRVDVTISYVLTGALAQVGRAGIVRDLVRRIGEAFAHNVDARLRGEEGRAPARIGGLGLLLQVLVDRVRSLGKALLRRRG